MANEKNSLVDQSMPQIDTYHAKGKDFPVKPVKAATDQSGPHGMAEGQDELIRLGVNLEGPRHCEDAGILMPSEWQSGGRSKVVAKCFPVGKNGGESQVASPSKMSIPEGVDIMSGKITGGSSTRVDEVFEDKVSIGR